MEFIKNPNSKNLTLDKVQHIAQKFSVSSSIAELLIMRGINSDDEISRFLNPDINQLNDPFLFHDMGKVVERINKAVMNKERILIFGDYDVDGVTSTYILLDYLQSLGAKPDTFLPNRYTDGYGLTMDTVDKVVREFSPQLIITVDCGISGYKEVDYIKSLGIDIIVTDHHDCPEILPNCLIIDAKRPNETYPFRELCGAGVAFKIVEAMAGREFVKKYLPVTALATVSDIVPLMEENRVIVKLGLDYPLSSFPLGIALLAKEMKIFGKLTSQEVSFKLAPKINASGRMGDANHSLLLYVEKNKNVLQKLIDQVLEYNTERQELCNLVYTECIREIKKLNLANSKVIVLSGENWNIGILGIVAARIVEEFNRPTFLLGKEGEFYKGSCRSIPGMDVHAILTRLQNVLTSFGGHVMAAGMTVECSKINDFKKQLNETVLEMYPDEFFIPHFEYDLEISPEDISTDYILELDKLQPFGCQNSAPLFKITFDKATTTPMKNNANHLTIQLPNITLLCFNSANLFNSVSQSGQKSAIIEMQVDTFRGVASSKGIVKHIKLDNAPNVGIERVGGEYIKQLALDNSGLKPNYKTYDRNDLNKVLNNFKNRMYGTLIIANTLYSYKEFIENNDFNNSVVCHEYLNISNVNGYNTICLCPSLNNDFSNYNQIILLDGVLDEAYIIFFNTHSNAVIYIPQKTPFIYAPFKSLDISRKVFGEYFHLFKKMSKSNMIAFDDYNYFNKLKRIQKNINYVQFVACLETFVELGLIEVIDEVGNFSIHLLSGNQTSLQNSHFYNKLELILKAY